MKISDADWVPSKPTTVHMVQPGQDARWRYVPKKVRSDDRRAIIDMQRRKRHAQVNRQKVTNGQQ